MSLLYFLCGSFKISYHKFVIKVLFVKLSCAITIHYQIKTFWYPWSYLRRSSTKINLNLIKIDVIMILWKESLSSDGPTFNQYHLDTQYSTICAVRNPSFGTGIKCQFLYQMLLMNFIYFCHLHRNYRLNVWRIWW